MPGLSPLYLVDICVLRPNNGGGVVHGFGLKKRGFGKNPDEEKGSQDVGDGGFVERKDLGVGLGENGAVKQCLTKWLIYSGCTLAMLTVVEKVEDHQAEQGKNRFRSGFDVVSPAALSSAPNVGQGLQ
ncbi:hypothetical protein ACLB2K_068683 [Fragaria x ananassa]